MTREEIIKEVLNEYRVRKQRAEEQKNSLLFSLYEKNPNLYEIVSKIRKLTVKIAQYLSEDKDATEIINEQNKLILEEREILKEKNINFDLIGAPKCEKCSDTGYVNGVLCECVNDVIFKKLLEKSNLNNVNEYSLNCEIDKIFKGTKQYNDMVFLYKYCQNYVKDFPNNLKKNILLISNPGAGKTVLITALCYEILKKGFSVIFHTAFSLHNLFLKYHLAPIEEKPSIIEPILDADLLTIDDLGTEPIFKNVTLEYLFLILDNRIMSGKNTIISTNLNINGLIDRYDTRLFSRITNKSFTYIKGIEYSDDLRSFKKKSH